jgi:hypothetical protein
VPLSFLSSSFPGTLILIAYFFAFAFFSNLKGLKTFLGLCARRCTCLKAAEAGWDHDVSGVIPGCIAQACATTPLLTQSGWIFL